MQNIRTYLGKKYNYCFMNRQIRKFKQQHNRTQCNAKHEYLQVIFMPQFVFKISSKTFLNKLNIEII